MELASKNQFNIGFEDFESIEARPSTFKNQFQGEIAYVSSTSKDLYYRMSDDEIMANISTHQNPEELYDEVENEYEPDIIQNSEEFFFIK